MEEQEQQQQQQPWWRMKWWEAALFLSVGIAGLAASVAGCTVSGP